MNISKFGCNYRHSAGFKINRPNGSGNYLLLLLRSPAFFVLKGEKHIAKPNSVILFQKGTPQLYGAHGEDFINDWVHFEMDERELAWLEQLGLSFDTLIETPNASRLSELMRSLCQEKKGLNLNGEASAALYLQLLLMKLSDMLHHNAQPNPELYNRLLKLKEAIYAHPQKPWIAEEIARELSLSLSHLQHSYKTYFSVSLKQDVLAARLQYAQHLLFTTNDTINSVAQACGFSSDVHFMRLFKKHLSLTPSEYRKTEV